MRTHFLVTKNTGAFDTCGHMVKEYSFQYTLPFKSPSGYVDSPVCGNAFSWAYGLGKNTRTEYERTIRAELARESPANFSLRSLR